MDTKICRVCQVPKLLKCFRVDRGHVRGECYECAAAATRKHHAENPEKVRESARKWAREHPAQHAATKRAWRKKNPEKHKSYTRKVLYGISGEAFDARVAAQGGVCAICGGPPTAKRKHLSVDHCHETGQIRGLLCGPCNTGIGQLRDSPVLLQKALDYLKNFVPTQKP